MAETSILLQSHPLLADPAPQPTMTDCFRRVGSTVMERSMTTLPWRMDFLYIRRTGSFDACDFSTRSQWASPSFSQRSTCLITAAEARSRAPWFARRLRLHQRGSGDPERCSRLASGAHVLRTIGVGRRGWTEPWPMSKLRKREYSASAVGRFLIVEHPCSRHVAFDQRNLFRGGP